MRDTNRRTQSTAVTEDTKPVSMRVVDVIASRLGCDPVELEPLAKTIDPEALDTVVETSAEASVSFEYDGFTVQVTTEGEDTTVDVTRNLQVLD